MKEIMYSSITGNTKKLAELINANVEAGYCGKLKETEADTVFIGFWATKNSCSDDVKKVLEGLSNKNIFIFGTCGYNNSPEFYNEILGNVKSLVNSTNTIIGEFICQAPVSENKRKALKETHPNYENMVPKLEESLTRPTQNDLDQLVTLLKNL